MSKKLTSERKIFFVHTIGKMISFKLDKEIEKDVFCLVTSVGQRKIIEPQTFGLHTPILYH